jgi:glycosyltransferase involved in cell wall biosynthesis
LSLRIGTDASVVASSSGGTRTYALQLLGQLVELHSDWNFVLYLRRASEANHLANLVEAPNVRTQVVDAGPNAWRVQAVFPRRLVEDRIDVYHSLGYFLPLRWKGLEVVTIHDLNVYATARNWLRTPTLLPWLDLATQTWLSVRRADHVIAVSDSTRDQLRRIMRLPDERVTVIPEAADPFFSAPPSERELADVRELTSYSPFVLFVGILSPQKNLLTLVRAFASSRLSRAGVRLVIAGSDRERYAEIVRGTAEALGVGKALVMPGYVSNAMLRALYHKAICLVLPSHGEGFGLPLVEAMACGTPIVAANRQAIPEVLGHAGGLFEPDLLEELARLLDRVASDDRFRQELAKHSRERAKDFSWRRTAELTAEVYERVVGSKRR